MATVQKITLSASRDIPFNKLVLSQANVRRIKAGISLEELAEDIARRTLLQSIVVRPVLDADGAETGMYEIPAGGRRYRALELLVKRKRLSKTAPVPCVVRTEGFAEEDSLAENVQRAPLHALDQFRAFLAMREKGKSEEDIAAAFFVAVTVVKQRLRLASVSPKLLEVYAEDGMTLDQLMAFTVSADHERQEQVFELVRQSHDKQPYAVRRLLTQGAVRASDKRALCVGCDAYVEAGGTVLRDLFQGDDGGWLEDVGLVDRLVAEKLDAAGDAVRVEGWKWVEVAPDLPYGHAYGLRRLSGDPAQLTDVETAALDALRAEAEGLEAEHQKSGELPEAVDQRLGEIETAIAELEERPIAFEADDIARAGVFVSIAPDGRIRVERGFVRPEDERAIEPEPAEAEPEGPAVAAAASGDASARIASEPIAEPEEDEGLKPIPDRLMTELTAHRTLALRDALGQNPDVAFLAALHCLALEAFYPYSLDTCLELDLRSASFTAQAPGLNDSASARAISARHDAWRRALPKESGDLWDALQEFDGDSRQSLFAHCIALSVNATVEAYNRKPRSIAHADRLAAAVDLDMATVGWAPTAEHFLGRVTKARILAAVREARGERAAKLIDHLKKPEMAEKAEELLAGSSWLPEPLRTLGRAVPVAPSSADVVADDSETPADGDDPAEAEPKAQVEDQELSAFMSEAVAAE